jgi:hypothetical protein
MTAPNRRWFDRRIGGGTLAEWGGIALLIIGGANAVGASKWAQRIGSPWHPLAWLVFLPIFGAGCAILFWSLRRDRVHDDPPDGPTHS